MTSTPTVWALVDDKPGHASQVLGLAAKLGLPFLIKHIDFNRRSRWPNFLLGANLGSLTLESQKNFSSPLPDVVITAGKRMIPLAKYIRLEKPEAKLIHIMWPGNPRVFDMVIVPEHDNQAESERVVNTIGALHGLTQERLIQQSSLTPPFAHLAQPFVGVLVGGHSKHGVFHNEECDDLIAQAAKLAGRGSLIVTTSRRTPAYLVDALQKSGVSYFLHEWDSAAENQYINILSQCAALVVTGDSVSMCSEACFTGKPVFIFSPRNAMSAKHHRFVASLFGTHHACGLNENASLSWQPAPPLDEAARVAKIMRERLKLDSEGSI